MALTSSPKPARIEWCGFAVPGEYDAESGQAALLLLLTLSLFLLAGLAFAVDLSNMWFHR
jgi:hypothetical protein